MRPRHWKQLLRLAGGVIQISNEGLTRMTLGQLLDLGLHSTGPSIIYYMYLLLCIISCLVVLWRALPYRNVLYFVVPCRAVPCGAVLCY